MKLVRLPMDNLALSFYQSDWQERSLTNRAFQEIGLRATGYIANLVFPKPKAGRIPVEAVLVGGIARAGCGLVTETTLALWRAKFPHAEVLPWSVGASRPKDPDQDPAKIYWPGNFHRISQYLKVRKINMARVFVVVFEFGLATASTLEAVHPHIRQSLPGIKEANIIYFAECACVQQSQRRLHRLSKNATFAYGSEWQYSLEPETRFYLNQIRINSDGSGQWLRQTPQDWGQCAFGSGAGDFIPFARSTVGLTRQDEDQIRWHFERRG